MKDAFVFDTVRTPRGKAKPGGGLNGFSPSELLGHLYRALEERTGLKSAQVDDVVIGCASQVGEQGADIARVSVLDAGWGDAVPGLTINRFCASGLDAVNHAAARVKAGDVDLTVAGGVESVSRVPMFSDGAPMWTAPDFVHMSIAADLVATLEGFGKDELDAYGLRTHTRAAAAWAAGRFDRSLVPVGIDRDEHVRSDVTAESMAALPPAFADLGAQGHDDAVLAKFPELTRVEHVHSRATSPSLADAAAVALIGSGTAAFEPRARIVSTATRSVDPVIMLTAGQLAAEDAIAKAGLTPGDIEVFEFLEAFAALCCKFQRDLGVDDGRFNVNGGTLAMGHAFGASGAILLAQAIDELERRDARYACVAVSGAAGLGVATVVERVA